MGVGSLHSPREYDGRLPPDAGYYLDLVIPRFEEPRKKTRASYNNTMEDYEYKVSNYMQLYSRIVVNLLVILVEILVDLLVRPTKLG